MRLYVELFLLLLVVGTIGFPALILNALMEAVLRRWDNNKRELGLVP